MVSTERTQQLMELPEERWEQEADPVPCVGSSVVGSVVLAECQLLEDEAQLQEEPVVEMYKVEVE
jgi:hypothetical protein